MYGNSVRADLVGRLVEDEVASLVDGRRGTAASADGAAQDGLHPGDELLRPERFGDVVVGAELQAAEDVALVLAGREEQHGDVLVHVPDALQHHETSQLGKVDVEDDEVGLFASDGLDRGLSVVGAGHVVALTTKRVLEKLHEVAVVVND